MAALTRLSLLVEPKLLVRMSLTPAASTDGADGAAGDHAGAGTGRHEQHLGGAVLADHGVRDRASRRLTRFICLWASLTPFSTAGGTSLALP